MPSLKTFTAESNLQYLKGVGPFLASLLAKKNIYTIQDLIYGYPRTYRDNRVIHDFSQLVEGAFVTLYGYISYKKISSGRNKNYEMSVKTQGGYIICRYFRLPYKGYFDNLEIDQKVKIVGKVKSYRNQIEFHHPDVYPFNPEEPSQKENIIPIYSEIEKISQNKIRKIIETALSALKNDIHFSNKDFLPLWIKQEHNLINKMSALEQIHNPNQGAVEDYLNFRSPAQKRLIFEEFFLLQLYLQIKKQGLTKKITSPIKPSVVLKNKLQKSLTFCLTQAQKKVLNEITEDIKQIYPMHRLIQGDVGCGKTIVAWLACCPFIENNFQCAVMVPTEILAQQHYKNACALFNPLGINVTLLTGKLKAKQKKDILEKLATGYTSICIGTHALIEESVKFKKLGLVIIDEQHRFGVHQRGLLTQKGINPHFLVMTATPIPRSLSMVLYGDLNVSVIDELPKGRKSIVTKKTYFSKRDKVLTFLESHIREGRQAYIVYPLVEESENIDLKNATDEYQKIKIIFPDFTIGLLHGRLSALEKQEIMTQFSQGKIQILISTTVIEVGLDVANANIMIIEHAERFGLSQLHQLRGRVGRGAYKSYCILISSYGVSEESDNRLYIMEKYIDGFKIAEEDLKIRGPGEVLGTKQSGMPEFKMAHFMRDGGFIPLAKNAVLKLIKKDPDLNFKEHKDLKQEVQRLSDRLLPG